VAAARQRRRRGNGGGGKALRLNGISSKRERHLLALTVFLVGGSLQL